ncbi:MAG TPA: PQQ-binding-like beta-propeller repeat protein [Candidatus Acidoferrum sp.]|nr:PQQ-binding-like beta-propeller repeat protein [Candidatus Acidoferrum sp.]
MKTISRCLSLLASALLAVPLAHAAGSGYHVVKTVTLGGDGGFDYLNQDPDSGYLYITRGTHLMVVDVNAGKLVNDITGLAGIHGTAFANGKAYISEGGANKVTVVDTKTFAKVAEIAVGMNPDGILYEAVSKRIFTFNGRSNDATAIDVATGKVVGTVALGGKPEAASADEKGMLYVNVENKNELVAFDAKTLQVKAHYPLTGCESPSGQAMDVAHARLFAVCDGGVMAVADAASGKVVASVKIGNGPDAARFDPATGYAFSSNGQSGTLTVAHEDGPDQYTVLDNVETARGARTLELDLKTHQVFVVTADYQPVTPSADNPQPRPTPVPGSFRLIVLGR